MTISGLKAQPRPSDGFTLIEVIMVIVVLGIASGMAVPRMSGWVAQTRVDSVLNQLASDVSYARMLAVRTGDPVTVTLAPASYTIRVGGEDQPAVKVVNLADQSTGVALGQSIELRFNSRGLLLGGGTHVVTATRAGQSGSLRILPTGRAYRE